MIKNSLFLGGSQIMLQQLNLENIKWDHGGRLFITELTRKTPEGVRFFDCEGNLLFDCKDSSIQLVN